MPIDVIGIQSHQHQGYWGAEKLYEVLARFDHFGLPLHFTENTLTSGHIMPPEIEDLNDYQIDKWPSTPEFEDRQARETVEMYEILFAHPQVENAVSWNFVDGGWLGAPAGFIREDNSIKPVCERLWNSSKESGGHCGEAVTDANGEVIVEGYRGDYHLSCCGNEALIWRSAKASLTAFIRSSFKCLLFIWPKSASFTRKNGNDALLSLENVSVT